MNKFFTKVSLLFLSAMIFSLPVINASVDESLILNNNFLRFGTTTEEQMPFSSSTS